MASNRHRALPVVWWPRWPWDRGCDVKVGGGDFSLGVASGQATDEWNRRPRSRPAGRFEVMNVNGRCRSSRARATDVDVRAERIAKASSDEAAKELLAKSRCVETSDADAVRLETKAPKHGAAAATRSKYFVKVPAGVKVVGQTTNGGIRLISISNEVAASTTNGGVKATGCRATSMPPPPMAASTCRSARSPRAA